MWRLVWVLGFLVPPQDDPVPGLLQQLADESPAVRDRATRALRDLGDSAAPALRGLLEHKDAELRARAGALLRRLDWDNTLDPRLLNRYPPLREAFEIGDHRAVMHYFDYHPLQPYLHEEFEAYAIQLQSHPDLRLRKKATTILLQMGERRDRNYAVARHPISVLAAQIAAWDPEESEDPDRAWLRSLGNALLYLSSPLDREALLAVRGGHPDAERVLQILRAGVGIESAQPILRTCLEVNPQWPWIRELALQSIRKSRCTPARPAVFPYLVGDLEWWALQAMDVIADPSCTEELLALYRKTPAANRSWAWYPLLAKLRRADVVPMLLDAVDPKDSNFSQVLEALVTCRATEALDRLYAGMGDPQHGNLYAHAAVRIADAKTIGPMILMLESIDPQRRNSSRWALPYASDAGARKEVFRRLESADAPTTRAALVSIVTCGSFAGYEVADVAAAMEKIARNSQDPLATVAASHLLTLRGSEAVPIAEDALLASEKPAVGLIGQLAYYPSDRLVEPLLRLAARPELQYEVLSYLQELPGEKGRKALEQVRDLLRDQQRVIDGPAFSALDDRKPRTIEELRKILAAYDQGRIPRLAEKERILSCGTGLTWDNTGVDTMKALAAKNDRSLIPLFLERLGDPERTLQDEAFPALARLKATEAMRPLQRLVLSGDIHTRSLAIAALADVGALGTVEFLKERLRDNPGAASLALAQLGVDCRRDIARLLEEARQPAPLLCALDRMTNPTVYKNIGAELPGLRRCSGEQFRKRLEELLGVPVRSSELRGPEPRFRGPVMAGNIRTVGDALDFCGGVPVYRNGALELCTLDEAMDYWKPRLPADR